MVIFDLEWNSGRYERLKLNEILQIGAVRIERLGGPVVDTLNLYIRPRAHKRYSPPVLELPELDKIEASDLDFVTAARQFLDWCGEDRTFGIWGTSDVGVLIENFRYWGLPTGELPTVYYDLQAAFARAVGATRQLALYEAVEYCGFPDVFDYHDPRNDAFYTALVTWAIDESALREKTGAGRVDLTVHPPRWESPRYGPFATEETLLGNRACRLAPCPECGERTRVANWYTGGGNRFYAKFTCSTHGVWFLGLKIKRDREGRLFATTQVLEPTEGARILFRRAKEGRHVACRAFQKPRRRRRKEKTAPEKNEA